MVYLSSLEVERFSILGEDKVKGEQKKQLTILPKITVSPLQKNVVLKNGETKTNCVEDPQSFRKTKGLFITRIE